MSEHSQARIICHECDWVAHQPALAARESLSCPRCGTKLDTWRAFEPQAMAAWATAALMSLVLALMFGYLRFEAQGIAHGIQLLDVPFVLIEKGFGLLAAIVALTVIVLPASYLSGVLYLALCGVFNRALPGAWCMAHLMRPVRPWLMADVFVAGVLIGLIKIVTMADITLGPSFFVYCGFALLVLYTARIFDTRMFWQRFGGSTSVQNRLVAGQTAAAQGVIECATCSAWYNPNRLRRCPCCGHAHGRASKRRLQWSWALLISAAILLVPANVLPIMVTTSLGYDSYSTIIGGVVQLIRMGSWPIALVIFCASIVVPISKILILAGLCLKVSSGSLAGARHRARLYRMTEFIGRWSMIDVFVVSVLTALIQAGGLMTVEPGPAAAAFAGAVILTMLAVMTFDPRLIWQQNTDGVVEQGV